MAAEEQPDESKHQQKTTAMSRFFPSIPSPSTGYGWTEYRRSTTKQLPHCYHWSAHETWGQALIELFWHHCSHGLLPLLAACFSMHTCSPCQVPHLVSPVIEVKCS